MSRTHHIDELDILRGFAAVLMITNHLVVTFPDQPDSIFLVNEFAFIGSFAPVLFFFVTGVGAGVSVHRQPADRADFTAFWKVGFLIWADQLMQWRLGNRLGLDFLGFIAFTILVLQFVMSRKSPLSWCCIGVAGILFLRYAVSPSLKVVGGNFDVGLASWILGMPGVEGVSYLPVPWLVYPLLGFAVGFVAKDNYMKLMTMKTQIASSCLLMSFVFLIPTLFIIGNGGTLFRWGTVSVGFFVASIAMIFFASAFSFVVSQIRTPIIKSIVSLNGVASLSVVPFHYSVVAVVAPYLGGLNTLEFLILLTIVLGIVFLAAHYFADFSHWVWERPNKIPVFWCLVAGVIISSLYLIANLSFNKETALSFILTYVGVLALTLLFAFKREPTVTVHPT